LDFGRAYGGAVSAIYLRSKKLYEGKHFYLLLDDLEKKNQTVYVRKDNNYCLFSDLLDEYLLGIAIHHSEYSFEYTAEWEIKGYWNANYYVEKAYKEMKNAWLFLSPKGKSINKIYYYFYTIDNSELIYDSELGEHDVVVYYRSRYKDKFEIFKEEIERIFEGSIVNRLNKKNATSHNI
jgi:hypothetical protein